ncbi:MAG: tetratricopeptide repeat protein [Planctomycetales bacterium]|nr:tetratricopeptide repeat protein [Planctomycetales bacterium]
MRLHVLLPLMAIFTLAISRPEICSAEDTVTFLTGKDAKTRTNRTGEIVEYTGESLQLKSSSGRIENVPAARVVDIRTQWIPTHARGDALRAAGKLEEAINAYKQAKRDEPRAWVRRKIMASLVACYAEISRFDFAGDEWLAIASSDPSTLYYNVAPVAWQPLPPNAELQSRATTWLNSKSPPAQVLGASWLLGGPQRSAAITVLEGLASSKTADPRVRSLAQIQLWRTKLVSAKLEDVQRWQTAVEQMPAEVRAGGYFVVGEGLARLNKPEGASLAFLRIPLVHTEQRMMAADALLAAGKQLETLKRSEEAVGLYREVLSGYSRTLAAGEAKAKLESK